MVDDDFRNIFALSALLERGHASRWWPRAAPRPSPNWKSTSDVDIVLMDIMMPGMDGYETIRSIRAMV